MKLQYIRNMIRPLGAAQYHGASSVTGSIIVFPVANVCSQRH